MEELIKEPWPWYIGGPMIALVLLILLLFGRSFGVSSNFRTMCSACGAGKKISFFDFDWKAQSWNLLFVLGAIIGGWISHQYLMGDRLVEISEQTVSDLQELGIPHEPGLVPLSVYNLENLLSLQGLILMVAGGFLIGFGSRYAGGCTSGHGITGLSNLQIPSLIAVIGFFVGGVIVTHWVLPWIMAL